MSLMKKSDSPNSKKLRLICWLFFLALTFFYLSLTPGTIEGQGYNRENLIAANQIVTNVFNTFTGRPLLKVEWTRHGFVEPLFHLPFATASRVLPGDPVKWTGRLAVLQPILATAILCALVLIWAYRLTESLRWGVLLAACAGLGTMLWPYVYIGLETTQSLALLLVAFIVLGREPKKSWSEALLFAVACAVTVTVKLNGVFLAPAVVFLIFEYFAGLGQIRHSAAENADPAQSLKKTLRRTYRLKLAVVLTTIAVFYALNHLAKSRYWAGMDAGVSYFFDILTDSPLTAAMQAFAYFGSPNKSLFLFCPVLALSFLSLGKAWRQQPRIVILTLLTLGGLIGGFSITRVWADETWGPRYLHATIAPLILCLAASCSAIRFQWRQTFSVVILMLAGMAISLQGSLFAYDLLHKASIESSQSTLEKIQHDLRLNHQQFNWQLFKIWVGGTSQSKNWPAPTRWWFVKPDDAPPEKTIDLSKFARPQTLLAQSWKESSPVSPGLFMIMKSFCAACLAISLLLWTKLIRLLIVESGKNRQDSRSAG